MMIARRWSAWSPAFTRIHFRKWFSVKKGISLLLPRRWVSHRKTSLRVRIRTFSASNHFVSTKILDQSMRKWVVTTNDTANALFSTWKNQSHK